MSSLYLFLVNILPVYRHQPFFVYVNCDPIIMPSFSFDKNEREYLLLCYALHAILQPVAFVGASASFSFLV